MKTQFKLSVVLVFLFLLSLSGLISQVSAEGKKDIFLQAYESYLKKNTPVKEKKEALQTFVCMFFPNTISVELYGN